MSLSRFLRKLVIGGCIAGAMPSLVCAQANYTTNGGQFCISGALAGDQTSPHLSINAKGGLLVWEDNSRRKDGLNICAIAINSALSNQAGVFRVNQIAVSNAEAPQVSLLADGGAIFAWQSGRAGHQNIYARFLSASNTWLSGDVLVNSYTSSFRRSPAAAALGDGAAAVVWSSYGQASANSMLDIYGQRLTAKGEKVGSEFRVNQFTSYNQRNPAVCALSGGGFAVVWVSEQQLRLAAVSGSYTVAGQLPATPSVDVFARVYRADGTALGSEFPVNTGTNTCSSPQVVGTADGGFIVVWSETEPKSGGSSMDIFARAYTISGSGTVGGDVFRINTYVTGDQFSPRICALNMDYMVVWTSMAQDGSGKGVFGRFLKGDGGPIGTEFRVNSTVVSDQMQPCVASDGVNRFLGVWASYVGATSFDLYGQVYAPEDYAPAAPTTLYARPASDPYPIVGTRDSGYTGTGGDVAYAPKLDFPPTAAFVATGTASNSFTLVKGTYSGLFYDETNGVSAPRAGYVSAVVATKGAYSGKLLLASKTYSFSGKFDGKSGWATNTIRRSSTSSLVVRMRMDADEGVQLGGTVTDLQQGWVAQLHADRLVYDKKTNPATANGSTVSYTVVIPPATGEEFGYAYATAKIDGRGVVSWSGTLADGTKVSQSTSLSREGFWPMYASLNSGSGLLMSWMQVAQKTDSDISGTVAWIRPAVAKAKYYAGGLTNSFQAAGSVYTPPLSGGTVMGLTSGRLVFSEGGLVSSFTNFFTVGARNKVSSPSANKLTLTFTASSGLFTGSTLNPNTGQRMSFQGVLFQLGTNGAGLFLGSGASGKVELEPVP